MSYFYGKDFQIEEYEVVTDQNEVVQLFEELDSRKEQLTQVQSKLNKLNELENNMKQQLTQNSKSKNLADSEKSLLEDQVSHLKSVIAQKKQVFEQKKQQNIHSFDRSSLNNVSRLQGSRIQSCCGQQFIQKEQQYEKQVQEAKYMVNQANNEKELALIERDEAVNEKNRNLLINKDFQFQIDALKHSVLDYQKQTLEKTRKIAQLEEINQELGIQIEKQSNNSKEISSFEEEQKWQILEKSHEIVEEKKLQKKNDAGKPQLHGSGFQSEDANLEANIESKGNKVKMLEHQIESLTKTKTQLEEDLLKGQENLKKQRMTESIFLGTDFDAVAQQSNQLLDLQNQIVTYEKSLQDMNFKTYLNDIVLPQIERSISQQQDKNIQRKELTQAAFMNILNELKEVCYKRQLLLTFTLRK